MVWLSYEVTLRRSSSLQVSQPVTLSLLPIWIFVFWSEKVRVYLTLDLDEERAFGSRKGLFNFLNAFAYLFSLSARLFAIE